MNRWKERKIKYVYECFSFLVIGSWRNIFEASKAKEFWVCSHYMIKENFIMIEYKESS